MDLGFETCGNATIIVYDRGAPVLVTDPWIKGSQYFGSWSLPYKFTAEQSEAFANVQYVWVSHGHPDHLNLDSLEIFRNSIILVPRHAGGRIASDLKAAGYRVQDLDNGSWLPISPRVRILSYADRNQDSAVLIGLGEQCGVLNLNDGMALGTRWKLKSALSGFKRRFVLRLLDHLEADMINYFTESGQRIAPLPASQRSPLGCHYSDLLREWGATHTAPFSCHHVFSRTDSQWASAYETAIEERGIGFDSSHGQFIPAYFAYDVTADRVLDIPVQRVPRKYHEPIEFGDDWSEPLVAEDIQALSRYFRRFEHVRRRFRFLNFRVAGRDNLVDLEGPKDRGITFEAPRTSLMKAVQWEIFDDLLIGNFAKTTLHGGVPSLYPDFTPYVAKYGDNGRAYSAAELRKYFSTYNSEYGLTGWLDGLKVASSLRLRKQVIGALSAAPGAYKAARRLYRFYRR